ncbi:uncharacterized protein K444DRAFT_589727 [Hyaloscypha bicolor E]|uniref:Heterokaryon incompatibility domain-containing protein n=1 Tax=Hyaloscypha bicolor E TaxID=1095630 RepID=A0A2J6TAM0_9HELO|nr:uncharacterized protein K444DRAFT_589727 [Hyaloscypha bicolor E]PMD60012.1 hypothetical protein K444DRAFT_589727 [Hyaloscypha bicolor E]
MDRNNSRYNYEPLQGPEQIRTLTLRGISNGVVECTIQQIKVSEGGYQALSYNKQLGRIPLTKNLNDALHDLWNADELTSKVFWVDQICIDQEGEEKNHQVAFMGQIYKNASSVITYLGRVEDEEEEQRGLEFLKRLDSHFSPNYEKLSQAWDLNIAMSKLSELPVSRLPDDLLGGAVSERIWQWLVTLCFGEWATRLWIVQEQMLNTDNRMLHGHQLLSWDSVAVMPVLFCLRLLPDQHVNTFCATNHKSLIENPGHVVSSIFSIWRTYQHARQKAATATSFAYSLLSNMSRFENMQCRDPRDYIFALLAISSDSIDLGITPDYSKSPKQVFLDTTISMVESHANLDYLTFACRTDNSSDLIHSSWAITSPRPAHLWSRTLPFKVFSPHPFLILHARPRFFADGKTNALTLKGRILDHFSFIKSPIYQSKSFILDIRDADLTETLSQLTEALSDVICDLGITLENAAALCRTLILDPNWKPTHGQGSPTQQTAYHFWCMNVWKDMHFQGRSFCTTQQRRVCSCMNKIESDDVIAAFRGGDRLYVLRPVEGGRYRLVGDAYVDGLMFGEAYEGVDADEVDYDIELM